MKSLHELESILSTPSRIAITHHYNPDADALGSTLALSFYLQKKGHECTVISPNTIPDFLKWMPGIEHVLVFEEKREEVIQVLNKASILFCLDFNDLSRTKSLEQLLHTFQGIRVMIDHHLAPSTIFDFGINIPAKSSTCEMVYDYIQSNQDEEMIDQNIAQNLYAGAMTDTGSFKFPCTTASVHQMVAVLIEKGIDTSNIHSAIFDTFKESRLRFLGYILSEKLQVFHAQHAAIISVSTEELNKFKLSTGDTEGIVNYPLSIKEIIFSTFISERENEIRMSFRSKGSFDVNQFARTYFNGGGHANAAGGKSELSLHATMQKLQQLLLDNENKLIQCYQESL
jgi:phosphoesterase RecJ-like protein